MGGTAVSREGEGTGEAGGTRVVDGAVAVCRFCDGSAVGCWEGALSASLSSKAESLESCSVVAVGMRSIIPATVSVMLSPGGDQRWPAAACVSARASRSAKVGFSARTGSATAATKPTVHKVRDMLPSMSRGLRKMDVSRDHTPIFKVAAEEKDCCATQARFGSFLSYF